MIIVKTTKMCFQVQYYLFNVINLFQNMVHQFLWFKTFVKDETIIQGKNYVALTKLKPL
jgi:hypothetical protein